MSESTNKKSKGGRPKKNLEDIAFDGWDLLDGMIVWADEKYCADELGMNIDTLAARIKEKFKCSFSEYKDKKKMGKKIGIFAKQYEVAMKGNVGMLIWLGKQYGQTDKLEQTVEAKVETEITYVTEWGSNVPTKT